jgi:hypothetical protein
MANQKYIWLVTINSHARAFATCECAIQRFVDFCALTEMSKKEIRKDISKIKEYFLNSNDKELEYSFLADGDRVIIQKIPYDNRTRQ